MQAMSNKRQQELGMACAILCALLWGILPIYWKHLHPINPLLIMLYRLVLACILVFFAALAIYKWEGLTEPIKKKGTLVTFFVAGIVISVNWTLYIFMVNTGRIVQTSIGYYIEPLVVCAFGIIFFKEKLSKFKVAAIGLAAIGVCVMLLSYGQIPVLALVLAMSFATYAAIKKKTQAPALISLFYETIFLTPIAIIVIIYMEANGKGAFSVGEPKQIILLFFSGLFTAIPLSLFAMAANRISLLALGLTEYVSPTMGLILGIFLYKEPFDIYQLAGFLIIWIGLGIFTIEDIVVRKADCIPVIEGNPTSEGE